MVLTEDVHSSADGMQLSQFLAYATKVHVVLLLSINTLQCKELETERFL